MSCDCGGLAEAKKNDYCFRSEQLNDCPYYTPLEGEGKTETIKRTKVRLGCYKCGKPAEYRITFLLPNARINPASKGYRGDDISWCSDEEIFTCEEHKTHTLEGYRFCACFPLKNFPHMGLVWREEKLETEQQKTIEGKVVT